MDLLEYQAKELFREMGIPVLPSQRIDHPKDLKGLKIPYPVVLKSQVRAGRRGKAGGIKFVETTIDAVAAARTIFNLSITGEYPEVLLAEAKYDAEREFYLAVVLDCSARRPILLGSQQGGISIESALEQVQQVVVDQEFSPFYARRLALKMGLEGTLLQSVSSIIEKMYRLFIQNDLDLVEINPLAISSSGEVMALDGKVTVNDDALERHADLVVLSTKIATRSKNEETAPKRTGFNLVELEGNIAILCNGLGLAMTTLDLVYQMKGKPANFLNLGRDDGCTSSIQTLIDKVPSAVALAGTNPSLRERIERGLELVTQDRSVRVILINILSNVTSCEEIADAIAAYIHNRTRDTRSRSPLQVVVRLVGPEVEAAKERLAAVQVSLFDSIDEAVEQAVSLARPVGKNT